MTNIVYLFTPRKRPPSPQYTAKDILDGTYRGGLAKYRKDTRAHAIYVTWYESLTGKESRAHTS